MVRDRYRVGFTLVELLVVIGIIALLISILLPALSKARETANAAVCMSNMRQFGLGIQMYADQNKGALPQKGPDGSTPAPSANDFGSQASNYIYYDDASLWFNAIPPMVNGLSYFDMIWNDYKGTTALPKAGMRSIFVCPSASDAATQGGWDTVVNGYFALNGTENPINPRQVLYGSLLPAGTFKWASNYAFNSKLISSILDNPMFDNSTVRMSMLRPSSAVVIMVEKLNAPGEYKIQDVQKYFNTYPASYQNGGGRNAGGFSINSSGYNNNIGQTKADWRRFTTRHNKGGNLLFADGHVSHYSWLEAQIQPANMGTGTYSQNSADANQPSKLVWSIAGPVN